MNEHTGKELQDMTHLERLCVASCKVDWESLPTDRDPQDAVKGEKKYPDEYSDVVKAAKKIESFSGIEEENFGWVLFFDVEGLKPSTVAGELDQISALLNKHGIDGKCFTDNGYLIVPL